MHPSYVFPSSLSPLLLLLVFYFASAVSFICINCNRFLPPLFLIIFYVCLMFLAFISALPLVILDFLMLLSFLLTPLIFTRSFVLLQFAMPASSSVFYCVFCLHLCTSCPFCSPVMCYVVRVSVGLFIMLFVVFMFGYFSLVSLFFVFCFPFMVPYCIHVCV